MKRTISFMTGAGSTKHNERAFIAENVDKDRVQNNIEYCNEKIRDVYQKMFGEALEKYNASFVGLHIQYLPERMISIHFYTKFSKVSDNQHT